MPKGEMKSRRGCGRRLIFRLLGCDSVHDLVVLSQPARMLHCTMAVSLVGAQTVNTAAMPVWCKGAAVAPLGLGIFAATAGCVTTSRSVLLALN